MMVVSSTGSAQRAAARQSASSAQQGGFWELGFDAAINLGIDDPMTVVIDIPVDMLRAGYYVSDVFAIEPLFRWNTRFGKDQTGFSAYTIGVAGVYHMTPDRTKSQNYLRPLLMISTRSGAGAPSFTTLGFGVGMKKPMFGGRLARRLELNLTHTLETQGIAASTSINAMFGASVYTR